MHATIKSNSLSRDERLRRLGAIRRLFESGEGGFVYPLRYLLYAEPDIEPSTRVLFSVPKRYLKRANKRNLVRRRTKEAYRTNKYILSNECNVSLEIALIYSSKEVVEQRRIVNSVRKILKQISESIEKQNRA